MKNFDEKFIKELDDSNNKNNRDSMIQDLTKIFKNKQRYKKQKNKKYFKIQKINKKYIKI